MTTATAVTWPSLGELKPVEEEFYAGIEALELLSRRLGQLADVDVTPSLREGAPAPSLADIGALTWIVEHAALTLEGAQRYLDDIRCVRDAVCVEIREEDDDAS